MAAVYPDVEKRVSQEYRQLTRFFSCLHSDKRSSYCVVFHLLSVALNKYISASYHYASKELRCMCAQLFPTYKKEENYMV